MLYTLTPQNVKKAKMQNVGKFYYSKNNPLTLRLYHKNTNENKAI